MHEMAGRQSAPSLTERAGRAADGAQLIARRWGLAEPRVVPRDPVTPPVW